MGYTVLMAVVGSSAEGGSPSTGTESYTDVTDFGTLEMSARKFTTSATLVTGSHYKFKIMAYNGVGDSEFSESSDVMIAAVLPSAPLTPTKVSATKTSITISWVAPTSTGGAVINNYLIYSNMGTGTVYSQVGSSTSLQFLHNNLSPSGMTVSYKVTAVNDIGEGPTSTVVSILLGTKPAIPAAPTRVSATQTEIAIEWVAPDNGGTPILSYSV